jgi:hypothetical protein
MLMHWTIRLAAEDSVSARLSNLQDNFQLYQNFFRAFFDN